MARNKLIDQRISRLESLMPHPDKLRALFRKTYQALWEIELANLPADPEKTPEEELEWLRAHFIETTGTLDQFIEKQMDRYRRRRHGA